MKKLMFALDRCLKFTYIQNGQFNKKSLRFHYVDEYTAKLTNPICQYYGVKIDVLFDHDVIDYLKQIDGKMSEYYFDFDGIMWLINPLPIGNYFDNLFGLNSGDVIYDGSKLICTNPILNQAIQNIPTE